MRIGVVSPYSFAVPGGVQNHVLGLAAWLGDRGHAVAVLGPDRPGNVPQSVSTTCCGKGLPIRYNGSIARVTFGPRTARQVVRWLDAGEFDIVHVHEPLTPSASLLALRAARVPVVATFHTANPVTAVHRICGGALRATLDRIALPIAVSETAARLARVSLARDLRVIPNGIALPSDAACPHATPGAYRSGGAAPRITFLGRDEPRKGLATFLAATPAIRAHYPAADIVVASNTRRRLPPGVRLLPTPTDTRRDALLRTSDVYVAPHVGRESFGIVILEALAAGASVVASDLTAFRDTGSDAVRYFPAGSATELARAVIAELAAPRPASRRRAVATSYAWDRVGPRIESVYHDVRVSSGGIA